MLVEETYYTLKEVMLTLAVLTLAVLTLVVLTLVVLTLAVLRTVKSNARLCRTSIKTKVSFLGFSNVPRITRPSRRGTVKFIMQHSVWI